jgi:hypothetical protein
MTKDLDVDLEKVLIADGASAYKDSLPPKARLALYRQNDLVEYPVTLSDEEREKIDEVNGPSRPGFDEAIKSVLP